MHTTHFPKYGGQKYGTGEQVLAGWGYGGYGAVSPGDTGATSTAVTLATDFATDLEKQAAQAKQASIAASATGNPMMAAIMMAAGTAIQNQAKSVEATATVPKPPPPATGPNWGTWAVVGLLGVGLWAVTRRGR
jgi:hypothetical protein